MGAFFRPGIWYQELIKPSWTPPGWAFPVVWTILYFLMGITLYLLWQKNRLKGKESFLYGMQLVFNGAWSPIFFGTQEIGKGLIVIGVLWLTVFGFLYLVRKDKWLVTLNVPYLIWLSVALSLNAAIYKLN